MLKRMSAVLWKVPSVLWMGAACAAVHAPIKAEQIDVGVPNTAPLTCGVFIPEERSKQVLEKKPSSYKGSLQPYILPVGRALEFSSVDVLGQVFRSAPLVRTLEEATQLECFVEPELVSVDFQLIEKQVAVGVQGTASVRLRLFARDQLLWEKTVMSPNQVAPDLVAGGSAKRVGAVTAKAIAVALASGAKDMADSAALAEFVKTQPPAQ